MGAVWVLWAVCVRGWRWRPVLIGVVWRGAEDGSIFAPPRRSPGYWKSHDSLSLLPPRMLPGHLKLVRPRTGRRVAEITPPALLGLGALEIWCVGGSGVWAPFIRASAVRLASKTHLGEK